MVMGPTASPSSRSWRTPVPKLTKPANHYPKNPPASKPAPRRVYRPLRMTLEPRSNHHHPISKLHHHKNPKSPSPRHQNQRAQPAAKTPPPTLKYHRLSLLTTPVHHHPLISFQNHLNRSFDRSPYQNLVHLHQ